MNNEVERYLRRATRGLWGYKRREVREELSSHIQAKITAHRLSGLSEEDAVQKTLRELGNPQAISVPMTTIHSLPTALGLGAVIAAVGLSAVLLLAQTTAQTLRSSFAVPSPVCIEGTDTEYCPSAEPWFSLESLKSVLEPQGVKIEETPRGISLTFPGSSVPVLLAPKTAMSLGDDNGPLPADYQPAPGYYELTGFINDLSQELTLPIEVLGWETLSVTIGETKFDIDMGVPKNGDWRFNKTPAYHFYRNYLDNVAMSFIDIREGTTTTTLTPTDDTFGKIVVIEGLEDGIYGVISRTSSLPDEPEASYTLGTEIALSSEDGNLTFNLPRSHEKFVGKLEGLRLGESALVRLTGEISRGNYGYEVVPPEQMLE